MKHTKSASTAVSAASLKFVACAPESRAHAGIRAPSRSPTAGAGDLLGRLAHLRRLAPRSGERWPRLSAGVLLLWALWAAVVPTASLAAEVKSVKPDPNVAAEPAEAAPSGDEPQQIDVQAMKKRYWTVGNEDLMDVVQNRLYTKKSRLELGLRYGFWSDDPFVDAKTTSVTLGYHINEWFSIHALWAKVNSKQSSAADVALRQANFTPVTNPASNVYGGELRASFLYGKLSLLGSSIIYYDFSVAAGAATVKTRVANVLAPFGGVGQQIYLSRTFCVTTDYRILYRSENVPGIGPRTVTTNWIQLGLGIFFP